ncbi:MAG: DUF99 family protein [Methanomassiliicoccales archaeon]
MKSHVRVLGIDDSPFLFRDDRVLVVGTLVRLPSYMEGVMRTECQVDGGDATRAIGDMVKGSRYREQIRLAMVDGVALGGFNVVDITSLHRETDIPFATVTRDPPDMEAMESALRAHFPDWEERMEIIRGNPLHRVATDYKDLYVAVAGMGPEEAAPLIRGCTVKGALPEPIRMAHLIATAMARGESRGRA